MSFQVTQVEIPAEEFENLIMEFLPITADQLKMGSI